MAPEVPMIGSAGELKLNRTSCSHMYCLPRKLAKM